MKFARVNVIRGLIILTFLSGVISCLFLFSKALGTQVSDFACKVILGHYSGVFVLFYGTNTGLSLEYLASIIELNLHKWTS
jgi:hypothetical protein